MFRQERERSVYLGDVFDDVSWKMRVFLGDVFEDVSWEMRVFFLKEMFLGRWKDTNVCSSGDVR